ncbi:MAG: YcxB family protein [Acidimicrobiaceae bacterium]|nr:YcxB family protein [Acidimicrobiaceae bacterium]
MAELSEEDRKSLERGQKAAEEQQRLLDEGKGRPHPNPDKWRDPIGLDWEGKPYPRHDGQASRSGDSGTTDVVGGSEHIRTGGQLESDHSGRNSDSELPPHMAFRLTVEDFLTANRFHRDRYDWKWLWYLAIFSIIAIGVAAQAIYTSMDYINLIPLVLAGFTVVFCLCCIVWLIFWPYLSISTRRKIRRTVEEPGDSTVDMDEGGVRFGAANTSSIVRWEGFRSYAESDRAFLLYYTDSRFTFIPKGALTPEVTYSIRALLSRKLPPR